MYHMNYNNIRHFYQAATAIKINNLRICFCSFDLSYPIVEKDNLIKTFFIVCLVLLLNSILFYPCLFRSILTLASTKYI